MNNGVSGIQLTRVSSRWYWAESLILGLGVPALIWIVSRLISFLVPGAEHGSPEQRYLLWILGGVIVEWAFVVALWFVLRKRRIVLQKSRSLAHRNMACMGYGASVCGFFHR